MTDLFSQTNGANVDPNKDYFNEYVGEGKKFKTPQELARGKAESDAFIARLQAEQAALREELNNAITEAKSRKAVEEFMDRLTSSANGTSTTSNGNPPGESGNQPSTALDPTKIEELVETRLNAREQDRLHRSNAEFVKNELERSFGSDYVTKLAEVQADLGLSKEKINELAATQPKAFLRIMGVGAQESQTQARQNDLFTPPASTTGFRPNVGPNTEKNFAHYEDIRKADPVHYWSPQVQNEMFAQASKLGDRFYS